LIFAHALLEDVKGGFIAGLGLAILFIPSSDSFHIENAFNESGESRRPEA